MKRKHVKKANFLHDSIICESQETHVSSLLQLFVKVFFLLLLIIPFIQTSRQQTLTAGELRLVRKRDLWWGSEVFPLG